MGVIMKHEELENKTKQELKKIIIGYQLMVLINSKILQMPLKAF